MGSAGDVREDRRISKDVGGGTSDPAGHSRSLCASEEVADGNASLIGGDSQFTVPTGHFPERAPDASDCRLRPADYESASCTKRRLTRSNREAAGSLEAGTRL